MSRPAGVTPDKPLSKEDLLAEVVRLREEVNILRSDVADLEVVLETAIEQYDYNAAELHNRTREVMQEKADLEIVLNTTTECSDLIEATLRDRALSVLRESEQRLRQFLDAMPVGVFVVNAGDNQPYYANHQAMKLLAGTPGQGDPAAEIMHNLMHSAYGGDSDDVLAASDHPITRGLQGHRNNTDNIEIHCGGRRVPLEVGVTPIFDATGTVIYVIAVFHDISARKQAEAEQIRFIQEVEAKNAALRMNEKLQLEIRERMRAEAALREANRELSRLASLDGLTQVASRRRFDEYLDQEWRRMQREQASLALILCDVDYFKAYNDNYGHQAGDDCLKQVAQAIVGAVKRASDLVARYGGEEFAVVLPDTSHGGAYQVAQNIQQILRQLNLVHAHSATDSYITISIGFATLIPSAEKNPAQLISLADKALYAAKARGRNCIISADATHTESVQI